VKNLFLMRVFQKFQTHHDDVIHDISYDYYGKRIATCSSDQQIKIWDWGVNNTWQCTAKWKAHLGSVWKVAWAHPEFGQILASCSVDRTICIWEEPKEGEVDDKGERKWHKRAELLDSRDSVSDIKFAPKHLGLKLATCSADGFVRIYEAIDIMNISHWPLLEEFEAQRGGANCLSWNPSSFTGTSMLSVGSDEKDVKIWACSEAYRKWTHIETLSGHQGSVHDVSWAPNLGRSYHLIATASKDMTVRIWKLQINEGDKFEVTQVACFNDHRSEVWRVEWNITGTVLASSGDDSTVRLWKASPHTGQWKSFSTLTAEEDSNED